MTDQPKGRVVYVCRDGIRKNVSYAVAALTEEMGTDA
jgi:hypothetical protein